MRGLLRGEDVLYREGARERWIRLLHRERNYYNLDDPVPIYVAAHGPRALDLVGEVADGWVTANQPPERFADGFARIAEAARAAGRDDTKPYTTMVTTACILRKGESLQSQRVIDRVGPMALFLTQSAWETLHGGGGLGIRDDAAARDYDAYIEEYGAAPADRRYLDVHEGHMIYLKPGEERFVREEVIGGYLVGQAEEVVERVRAFEAAGVDNIALHVTGDARAFIEEFSSAVIARM